MPLLSQVVADVGVAHEWQARRRARDERGDVIGDQVLMRQCHDRQVLADHRGHLAAAIARRIDHVLGLDRSCRGLDSPTACGQLANGSHSGMPVDGGAEIARALGERLRQLRRVDIAILGIPETQADSVELEERMACLDLRGREQLEVEVLCARL